MTLHTEREAPADPKIHSHSLIQPLGSLTQMLSGSPQEVLWDMLSRNLKAIEEAVPHLKPRDWANALVEVRVQVLAKDAPAADGPSDG